MVKRFYHNTMIGEFLHPEQFLKVMMRIKLLKINFSQRNNFPFSFMDEDKI